MALTLRLTHRSHARQAVVLGEILLIQALASVATFKVSAIKREPLMGRKPAIARDFAVAED